MGGGTSRPAAFGQVRVIDAGHVGSYEAFCDALSAEPHVPLVLRNAPTCRCGEFSIEALRRELDGLELPHESSSHGFFVGDQGSSSVMEANAAAWHPRGCGFGVLAAAIAASGSSLYLAVRSANRACRRVGDAVLYDSGRCADGSDGLLRALVARAPVPLLLPRERNLVMAFWMGSKGKNFGLHTDLYTEQFLVQNQGVKEVFLLLPEDAAVVAPFPFVHSEKFYKSALRSVSRLELPRAGCLRATLQPDDVLYIPPVWWHELRTVSDGPSLTTTFRIHLEDNKRFYAAIDAIYKLCKSAREQGNEGLARHLCSFFAHGVSTPLSSSGARPSRCRWQEASTAVRLVAGAAAAAALLAAGFTLGRCSAFAAGHRAP